MPSIDLSPIPIPPPTVLDQVRTSKLKQTGPVLSGIDKKRRSGRLYVSKLGTPEDEHDLTYHGGIDKAVHHYCSDHYASWQFSYPDEEIAARFKPGGFGENLVASCFNETNICIGDVITINHGKPGIDEDKSRGCMVQVSLPRQPCFKLNQRFGIRNFAPKTHQTAKTGWYYRVLEEGWIEEGMAITVVERPYPTWSIARLHHYVHRDKQDLDVVKELANINAIGNECRNVFVKRLKEHTDKVEKQQEVWRPFRVAAKNMETSRIVCLELEAINKRQDAPAVLVGSYALIQLPNGMKRAYSIIDGTMDNLTLAVARDDNSRGGSTFIHDHLHVNTTISLGTIKQTIGGNGMASHSIFIIGGIGITAFLALMRKLHRINQSIEVHYAVRTADDVPFKTILSELAPHVRIYDKSKFERINIANVLRGRLWNSHVFSCGPQRMIDAVCIAAKEVGINEDEVHCETFSIDIAGEPFTADVVTKKRMVKVEVGSGQTLLQVMRDVGLDVGSSCEAGQCGTCRVVVKCGDVDHRGTALSNEEKKGEMLSYVSRGVGHIVVEMDK